MKVSAIVIRSRSSTSVTVVIRSSSCRVLSFGGCLLTTLASPLIFGAKANAKIQSRATSSGTSTNVVSHSTGCPRNSDKGEAVPRSIGADAYSSKAQSSSRFAGCLEV
jgi:hypothetical protein